MFNTKILAQQEFNTANILEYSGIEKSYYSDTLKFIEESMAEYRNVNMKLYKDILESSGDEEVINESFSDFFQSVKKIIDKFIKYIKSLFERFVIALNKFIASDKFIAKHKEDLNKFSDIHKFNIDGYNFSIYPGVPTVNAQAKFEESFIQLDFSELQQQTDQKKIAEIIKDKYSKLTNEIDSDWYDKFRGSIIGKNPIAKEDYVNELFKLYRSGASDKENIEITNLFISAALARFQDYKKIENETKRIKEQLERDYENIKKQVQNIVKQNSTRNINDLIGMSINSEYDKIGTGSLNVSVQVMNQIDLFTKKKAEQIMEMSTIHSLAFSYKLDAIKDCYKQDKSVLYQALSRIAKVR